MYDIARLETMNSKEAEKLVLDLNHKINALPHTKWPAMKPHATKENLAYKRYADEIEFNDDPRYRKIF